MSKNIGVICKMNNSVDVLHISFIYLMDSLGPKI